MTPHRLTDTEFHAASSHTKRWSNQAPSNAPISGDDRAALLLPDPVRLAVQVRTANFRNDRAILNTQVPSTRLGVVLNTVNGHALSPTLITPKNVKPVRRQIHEIPPTSRSRRHQTDRS